MEFVKRLIRWFLGIILVLAVIIAGLVVYIEFNQQKLLDQLQRQLASSINGTLIIRHISLSFLSDFPHLSLTAEGVSIRDSLYKQEVFGAGRVYFRLNVADLLRFKVTGNDVLIEQGHFYLKRDTTGYFNANIFRLAEEGHSEGSGPAFELQHFETRDLKVVFDDYGRQQEISLLVRYMRGSVTRGDSSYLIPVTAMVHTDSLMFRRDRGSFLVNREAAIDAHLEYDSRNHRFGIRPSSATIDSQTYSIDGLFAVARDPVYFEMRITHPGVDFNKARLALSDTINYYLKNMDVVDPVAVHVFIRGNIDPPHPPMVDVGFHLNEARINAYGLELTDMKLDGLFMNHVDSTRFYEDNNSALVFTVDTARINGVPLKGELSVTDLQALHLKLSMQSQALLSDFNVFIPNNKYRFTYGNANVQVNYAGTLYYYLDSLRGNHDDSLWGSIAINKGRFDYFKRNIVLDSLQATIDLGINTLAFKNFSGRLNGNFIALKGSITSLRRLFDAGEQRMNGVFDLLVPHFDLTGLITEKDLAKPPAPLTQKQAEQVAAAIDELTDRLNVLINLRLNSFRFRQFTASQVRGAVNLSSTGAFLKDFKLNACKGSMEINGGLNTGSDKDVLEFTSRIRNVDIQQLFRSAENFKQDAITDSNMSGSLSADVQLRSPLTKGYLPILDSMEGVFRIAYRNGALRNFQPLMDVGKTIFKKRNFADIRFAELHDTLLLRRGRLYIKRMEISSTVFRVFVLGYYAFKGTTDMVIQFPLSNLRRQDADYKPENIGLDGKLGAHVVVRVRGENNKMKISLDPLAVKKLEAEIP